MTRESEQNLTGAVPLAGEPGQGLCFELDPLLASSEWVLVRGRVELPQVSTPRGWLFGRRKASAPAELPPPVLQVLLPDSEEPRALPIGAGGEFETRFALSLPRLRSAGRRVHFSVRYHGQHLEQWAPLFMPRPGATLGVIVFPENGAAIDRNGSTTKASFPRSVALVEASRELTCLLSSPNGSAALNPVFYVGLRRDRGASHGLHRETGWPEGLAVPVPHSPASARMAVEQAAWVVRLMELYSTELEFVIVADTSRHTAAVLRALSHLEVPMERLRAIFLSDTRPVARGVMRQTNMPSEIEGLELPIVVCRTLEEARRSAETCGLVPPSNGHWSGNGHSSRRASAAHVQITRYPVVFCHGMLGYSVLRLSPVDLENYFCGLREFLSERGFQVLMPQIGRTHGIAQRADQLRQAIGRWSVEPVNIIAHSMGGLDARYMISKLGMADRVMSLTTIATPHHGSYFADWFVDRFDAKLPFLRSLERLGMDVDGFRDVTRSACRSFNQLTPDCPRVRYFSYSAFQVARKIPPVLRRSHSLIARVEGANDGLVSEASAHWGEHVATLRADHLALVGERGSEYFDHLAFFLRIVEDLIRLGF